ncbi:peptidoglycan-binding domain-containing protein [Nocardioides bruguierae]|uniref:Peptidoglycan-binding protein n=1 Tax=Nocardioides bruguierae TaxID=2945102 RepID=A0A9X2D6P0_9ACTN|nr:peptidoglycan-binding protein [Nocardioides bruguierae]MCM0620075.1 peptidoglycan-binding protein [Nocardioides bruguierae]
MIHSRDVHGSSAPSRGRSLPRLLLAALTGFLTTALLSVGLVATSTAPASAAYPVLQVGSSGADVVAVQYLLTDRGFSTTADGQYGSGTEAAVSAFQSSRGLTADGMAGPQTIGALVRTLRQGDSGPAVQALQVELNKRGASLATDGAFGPATDSAVRSFQSSRGLSVDGVAGPNTWESLFGGSTGTPGTSYDSLSDEQRQNARTIIGVGKGADVPEYGWVIALATAMQESTLINIDYGDRDSVGLFQQRPSQGWGTVAQCTDPVLASKAFYGVATHTPNPGLLDISGWQSMTVTEAAQAVQRSAYPDAYAKWESLARDIVAHESGAPAIY